MKSRSNTVFYVIVAAQFCGTSLWFAGNAILPQLTSLYHWRPSALAWLTTSTQLGFILGTLIFAALSWNDRFSPSKIFFISSLAGSVCNLLSFIDPSSLMLMLISRFTVGLCLAGIYPVGMKIAADWNNEGLGHWLGSLVGALVLGTAFPHSLKLIPSIPDAQAVLIAISVFASLGGVLIFTLVSDGPHRKFGAPFSFAGLKHIFSLQKFRAPAMGYFGHMWELYTMWAFVPVILNYYKGINHLSLNVPLWSFVIIGGGAAGCYLGGLLSFRYGSGPVAFTALACSGICCLISPLLLQANPMIFFSVMIFWGMTMAADSPQFSALVAKHAPEHVRGSAITIVICIGFAITIVSIQLVTFLSALISFSYLFLFLAPGPILGLLAMKKSLAKS